MIKNPSLEFLLAIARNATGYSRSAWMAQEILGTFVEEISEVSLSPSEVPGHFEIRIDGILLWCRKSDGGFPEVKDLKKRIRDRVAPDRDLGHIEGHG